MIDDRDKEIDDLKEKLEQSSTYLKERDQWANTIEQLKKKCDDEKKLRLEKWR